MIPEEIRLHVENEFRKFEKGVLDALFVVNSIELTRQFLEDFSLAPGTKLLERFDIHREEGRFVVVGLSKKKLNKEAFLSYLHRVDSAIEISFEGSNTVVVQPAVFNREEKLSEKRHDFLASCHRNWKKVRETASKMLAANSPSRELQSEFKDFINEVTRRANSFLEKTVHVPNRASS